MFSERNSDNILLLCYEVEIWKRWLIQSGTEDSVDLLIEVLFMQSYMMFKIGV